MAGVAIVTVLLVAETTAPVNMTKLRTRRLRNVRRPANCQLITSQMPVSPALVCEQRRSPENSMSENSTKTAADCALTPFTRRWLDSLRVNMIRDVPWTVFTKLKSFWFDWTVPPTQITFVESTSTPFPQLITSHEIAV